MKGGDWSMSLLGDISVWSIYFSVTMVALISILLAALLVRERSLVYGSFMLAGIGISVSGLIAFLGYQIIAAAQLIVYVGASVMLFIVSLSMLGNIKVKTMSIYKTSIISTIAFVAFYFLINTVEKELGYELGPTIVTSRTMSEFLTSEFLTQLFFISVSALLALISAIYIAKKGGAGKDE
jgi:NADH:ubiquinone oxidoreductase subunit 6 (subunit J)